MVGHFGLGGSSEGAPRRERNTCINDSEVELHPSDDIELPRANTPRITTNMTKKKSEAFQLDSACTLNTPSMNSLSPCESSYQHTLSYTPMQYEGSPNR